VTHSGPGGGRSLDLKGKRALVTGGARRIGAAIVQALADEGVRVAIHCNESDAEAIELQARCPGSIVICVDLLDREARDHLVPEAVRALGGLDILVNNAAIWEASPEISQEPWDCALELNLTAPVFLAQAAAKVMQNGGEQGVIINLTDWGISRPYPDRIAYFASKAGLEAATMGLAAAFAPKIRVIAIAPGAILVKNEAAAADATLLKKVGGTQSVADSVLFAAKNDFLTGTTLTIDGGRSLH
jgi:pteridine reductase